MKNIIAILLITSIALYILMYVTSAGFVVHYGG